MLKVPRRSLKVNRQKSVYRPIRRAKIDIGDGWQCISIDYPLVKIVKGCTILDFTRSILDFSILVVLLIYTLDIEYEDVMLSRRRANLKAIDATTYASLSRAEYSRIFKHTKGVLCMILGGTSVIVLCEVPLAIFLFRATQNQDRTQLIMWTQISICFIFFNFVSFTGIIVYSAKAGLILDNDTWVTASGANLGYLIYILLMRTWSFDLTKGAEVIVVNAFSKEIGRRKKVVSLSNKDLGETV